MEKTKKEKYYKIIDRVTEADCELYHRRREVEKIIIDEVNRRGGPFAFVMSDLMATIRVRNELSRMSIAAATDSYEITLRDEFDNVEAGFILEVWKDGDPEDVYVKGLYSIQNSDYDRMFKVPLDHVENPEEVLNFIMKYD